ncbi:MAG: DUF1186 domain-containing protein [Alphaproteobacteria bacterium]|nr:DUF1186 domain-containing protein [Alphaproteobacteria bacterium]
MTVQNQELPDPDPAPPIAVSEILARLSTTEQLSATEVAAILARYDEIAPRLRELLNKAVAGEPMPDDDIILFNHALYLFGARSDIASCQPLLRLLRCHPPTELIDTDIFWSLSNLIAAVFNGDAQALFAVASDCSLQVLSRIAALNAAVLLAHRGAISRSTIQAFLKSFPIDTGDAENLVLQRWIAAIAVLGLRELAPLVHHRMTTGDFGELIPDRPSFDQMIEEAERNPTKSEGLRTLDFGEIDDFAEALARGIYSDAPDNPDAPDDPDDPDDLDSRVAHSGSARVPSVQDILADLTSASYSRPDIIKACLDRLTDTEPLLRARIFEAAAPDRLSENDSIAVCRCIYILASEHDRTICQPVLRMVGRSERPLHQLLRGISPHLSSILVNVFDWKPEALLAPVIDSTIAPGIRAALLDAATFLTFQGKIARDRMTGFLRQLDLHSPTDHDLSPLLKSWFHAVGMLGLRELEPLVRHSVDDAALKHPARFRDEDRWGDFQQLLADAERDPYDDGRFFELGMGGFTSLNYVLLWHPVPRVSSLPPPRIRPAQRKPQQSDTPISNPFRNVGRNDPCPCGSGRKAEKCCMANNESKGQTAPLS